MFKILYSILSVIPNNTQCGLAYQKDCYVVDVAESCKNFWPKFLDVLLQNVDNTKVVFCEFYMKEGKIHKAKIWVFLGFTRETTEKSLKYAFVPNYYESTCDKSATNPLQVFDFCIYNNQQSEPPLLQELCATAGLISTHNDPIIDYFQSMECQKRVNDLMSEHSIGIVDMIVGIECVKNICHIIMSWETDNITNYFREEIDLMN